MTESFLISIFNSAILAGMDDSRWQVYRSFGLTFTAIGIAGLFISIAERLFSFRFFSGSAVPMSLLVLAMGLGLLQTVRQGRREARQDADDTDSQR